MKNILLGNKVPAWVIGFVFLTSLMGLGLSFSMLAGGDWTMAVRNVTAPMLGIMAVFMGRNFIPMFIAAILGRLMMEFGDMMAILTGQNPDGSLMTTIIVLLVIELVALAHLIFMYTKK